MGTLLAFTMVAISVLVVRYAPPYEMAMEVALEGTPESLISNSGLSEQDEQNLEDPFGNGNVKISFLLTANFKLHQELAFPFLACIYTVTRCWLTS